LLLFVRLLLVTNKLDFAKFLNFLENALTVENALLLTNVKLLNVSTTKADNQFVLVLPLFVMTLMTAQLILVIKQLENVFSLQFNPRNAKNAKLMLIANNSQQPTILHKTAKKLIAARKENAKLASLKINPNALNQFALIAYHSLLVTLFLVLLVMTKFQNASTLKSLVMMVINAPLTTVTLQLELVFILLTNVQVARPQPIALNGQKHKTLQHLAKKLIARITIAE
jgi:hypothetical protein